MDESKQTPPGGVPWSAGAESAGAGETGHRQGPQHDRITADDDAVALRDRDRQKVVRWAGLRAIKNNRATTGGHGETIHHCQRIKSSNIRWFITLSG